jgi:hypothetical protein
MSSVREKIRTGVEVLICVEGQDEEKFIGKFLTVKNANKDIYEIKCVGGSKQFHEILPRLSIQQNFQNIKTLAIVRDAEESFAGTVESIRGTLKKCGLPSPETHGVFTQNDAEISVGFFIMPGGQRNGMLENLCLDWFQQEHPLLMNCLESYHKCIEPKLKKPIPNIHKAKALMMLATTPDNATHLGLAAEQNFFNFDSPIWQELSGFFTQVDSLFKEHK